MSRNRPLGASLRASPMSRNAPFEASCVSRRRPVGASAEASVGVGGDGEEGER